MSDKLYIQAQELLMDSFQLGLKIYQSGFRPDFLVGVWRGGTAVGIAVQEILDLYGVKTDHSAIHTNSYTGIGLRDKAVRVEGLDYLVEHISNQDSLLIVDDVYDTGLSIQAIINKLQSRAGQNTPKEIRIATPWYKPKNNQTGVTPDYYLHDTDRWLVFPHELDGLSREEMLQNKQGLKLLLEQMGM